MDSSTEASVEDDCDGEILFENIEMLDDMEAELSADLSNFHDEELEEKPIEEPTVNESLYGCRLLAFVREFKGQSSGAHVAYWDIQAKSVNDFKNKLWDLARSHLLREVIFVQQADGTTVPVWSDKDQPEESDFGKFAIF